jgi:hypothetical protein
VLVVVGEQAGTGRALGADELKGLPLSRSVTKRSGNQLNVVDASLDLLATSVMECPFQ